MNCENRLPFYDTYVRGGEKVITKEIEANKEWNGERDYSHITDQYFLDKLKKGLIKYDPSEWVEMEEER